MQQANSEIQQLRDLILQMGQAKAQEYVQNTLQMLSEQGFDFNASTNGTARRTTKTTQKAARKGKTVGVEAASNRIFSLISDNPGILAVELKPKSGLSTASYAYAMKTLRGAGKIKIKGEKRQAAYFPSKTK